MPTILAEFVVPHGTEIDLTEWDRAHPWFTPENTRRIWIPDYYENAGLLRIVERAVEVENAQSATHFFS